jgi:hypothetical protein
MTYYVINNQITGVMEYFVPDEKTKLDNDHLVCFIGGIEKANLKVNTNKQNYLEQESYRFTIAKEVVDGNNTTWCNADLLNDTQEGIYQVFNQFTGLHEPIDGLTNAINRMNELKTQFLNQFNWDIVEINQLPVKHIGPYSQEIYGNTVGDIPVEVM